MGKSEDTPKRWHAYPTSGDYWRIGYNYPPPRTNEPIEANRANSLLISAAPEMLEALQKIYKLKHRNSSSSAGFNRISVGAIVERALAKALGE